MARVVHSEHPFLQDRDVFELDTRAPVTLKMCLDAIGIPYESTPYFVSVNGVQLAPSQFASFIMQEHDYLVIKPLLQDGGGDAQKIGGIVAIVGTLALAAATFGAGAGIGAVLAGTAGAAFQAAAIGGIVLFVGGTVLMATAVTPGQARGEEKANAPETPDVFSIRGQSNRARPFQPMPLVYGKMRWAPDLAAIPWSEYSGNEQYLNQAFHCGLVPAQVDIVMDNAVVWKIAETSIDNFIGVDTEIADFFTGNLTKWYANADTQGGVAVPDDTTPSSILTTSANTVAFTVNLEGIQYQVNQITGQFGYRQTQIRIEYKVDGTPNWVLGPRIVLGGRDTGIKRASRRVTGLAPNKYDVRIYREFETPDLPQSTVVQEVSWSTLVSFQPDTADYRYQLRVGVRIRASGQLNGIIDQFNLIQVGRTQDNILPQNDNERRPNQNPAWAFLDFARGRRAPDGRRMYGAGFTDEEIDLPVIEDWANFCDTNNLECNIVIKNAKTVAEILSIIARTGRAQVTFGQGKLGVIISRPGSPIALFGMSNIVRDSFRVGYVSQDLPDAIVAHFIDEDRNYDTNQLRVTQPGLVSEPQNVLELDFPGVTSLDQIRREVNLVMASQFYHRRIIQFDTTMEGFILVRGDIIKLSHDVTSWGFSGRLTEIISSTQVRLNRTVNLEQNDPIGSPPIDWQVQFRYKNGDIQAVQSIQNAQVDGGVETDVIDLATPLAQPTEDPLDIIWVIDNDSDPGKIVRVTAVVPRNETTITVYCTDEEPLYYDYENNLNVLVPPPPDYISNLPSRILDIQWSERLLDPRGNTEITAVVVFEGGADGFEATLIRNFVSSQQDNQEVEDFGFVRGDRLTFLARTDDLLTLRVRPSNFVQLIGDQYTFYEETYRVSGFRGPPPDVTGFTSVRIDRIVQLTWRAVTVVDFRDYEIRKGGTWEEAVFIGHTDDLIWRQPDVSGGTYWIKARDVAFNYSENATSTTVTLFEDVNIVVTYNEPPFNADLVDPVTGDNNYVNCEEQPAGTGVPQRVQAIDNSQPMEYITDAVQIPLLEDGGQPNVTVDFQPVVTGINLQQVQTWDEFTEPWDQYPSWFALAPEGAVQASYEVSTSEDGTTWTDFVPFAFGQYVATWWRFKVIATQSSDFPEFKPAIFSTQIQVDVPERIEIIEAFPVTGNPAGDLITFSEPFTGGEQSNNLPVIGVTIVDGASGDTYQVTNKTLSGFTLRVFDSLGSTVARNVDVQAIGF